jgi:glutamine cyclotransferase
MRTALLLAATMGTIGFARFDGSASEQIYGYTVVRSYPHDREAFTQGLIVRGGALYEGTGLNGRSGIRKVELETGRVLQIQPLDADYFGEGITEWKGALIQLTWRSEIAFVYDLPTFRRTGSFSYRGEGWGITHDGRRLIMSDGSAQLRFLDPETFKETGRVTVRDANGPVSELNELEFVKGEVFANVWQTDRIARIAPATGRVTGWIDLANLLPASERVPDAVLNGIAYDAGADRLFVTGKLWPRLFEITLVPRGAPRAGA